MDSIEQSVNNQDGESNIRCGQDFMTNEANTIYDTEKEVSTKLENKQAINDISIIHESESLIYFQIKSDDEELREIFFEKFNSVSGIKIIDEDDKTVTSTDYLIIVINRLDRYLERYKTLFSNVGDPKNVIIVGAGYTLEDRVAFSDDYASKFISSFLDETKKTITKLVYVDIGKNRCKLPLYDCLLDDFPSLLLEKCLLEKINTVISRYTQTHTVKSNLEVSLVNSFIRKYICAINIWINKKIDKKLEILKSYLSLHKTLTASIDMLLDFVNIAKNLKNNLKIIKENKDRIYSLNLDKLYRDNNNTKKDELMKSVRGIIDGSEPEKKQNNYIFVEKFVMLKKNYYDKLHSRKYSQLSLLCYYLDQNIYLYSLYHSSSNHSTNKLILDFPNDIEYLYELYQKSHNFRGKEYQSCDEESCSQIRLDHLVEDFKVSYHESSCSLT